MPCPVCASVKQVEFSFEMMVHRNDLKKYGQSQRLFGTPKSSCLLGLWFCAVYRP